VALVKLELQTSDFAEAAGFAARAIPRVPAMPALAGLLLTAEPAGGLRLAGYDVEVCSTMTAAANVLEPGQLLLPGRPVADVLRALPPGPMTATATAESIRIQTDIVDFSFPTMRLEDFPELPTVPPTAGTVPGAQLRRAIGQVAPVTSRDAVPPVLSAIRLELAPAGLRLVATDRYRLAFRSLDWTPTPTRTGAAASVVLVPAHELSAAATALDADRDWTIGADESHFTVDDGLRRSVLRLLDGSYPAVDRLVPTSFSCTLRADRDELGAAVRRVSLADEQRGRGAVTLDVSADRVTVEGGSGSSRGRQRVPAAADGESFRVAFTASYLIQALQCLDGETAQLGLNPGVGKVLVTAAGVDSYRHVLMSRQLPG